MQREFQGDAPSKRALVYGVCGLALALAATGGAAAQEADGAVTSVDEVVITGSRVVKDGTKAPTPVTVMSTEELQARAPSNLPDALNQLPQFRGSSGNNRTNGNFTGFNSLAGNYLNLRNLGTNRVLIQLDGVRVPPTSSNGGVDTNTLPQQLVERVEVVTGGASAAYGSDAVSGVVNFVLNKRFKGLHLSGQQGISRYKDAESNRFSVAAGTSLLDDRLHVMGSAEHYQVYGFNINDRPLGRRSILALGAGTEAQPVRTYFDTRYSNLTYGGLITTGPLAGQQFGPGGILYPFNPGEPTVSSSIRVGGDGAIFEDISAQATLRTDQLFGRVSYQFSPTLEGHAQIAFGESRTHSNGLGDARFPAGGNLVTIFADNAYLPPAVRAALGSTPSFALGRYIREGGAFPSINLNNSINARVGFDGQLGKWAWDAQYVHGFSVRRSSNFETKAQHLYAAVDAVRDPSGAIVCRATLTNPGLYPGCVPINLFGPGTVTPEALAYIRQPSNYRIANELNMFAANIRGDLFDLPAGPLAVGVGAEYRTQDLRMTTNADPATPFDRTGLRGVPTAAPHFRSTSVGAANGSAKVKEAYVEVLAPLLKDAPFAQTLDFNGAVRVTDYSTSGTVVTWKAGLSHQPFEGLRLRGTLSRDIAAPTLYQLYAGPSASNTNAFDPHTGQNASVPVITSGNADLVPEESDTLTAGFVFQPAAVPGLALSIDYYKIVLKDAIQTLDTVRANQECELSNGTSPVCAAIVRPLPFADRSPANIPLRYLSQPLNVAEVKQSGIDFELSYGMPVSTLREGWGGDLAFRAVFNYLLTQTSQDSEASPVINRAGSESNPRLRGLVDVNYTNEGLRLGVTARGNNKWKTNRNLVYLNYGTQPAIVYFDIHGSYTFSNGVEPFFSVQNLFDKKPPINQLNANPGLSYPVDRSLYDITGTYYTVGVRYKLP